MPKGALLHAHLDATVNAEFLYKKAFDFPEIHVRAPEVITTENKSYIIPQFLAIPEGTKSVEFGTVSVSDSSYQPNTWVPFQQARQEFSQALGGPEGFDKWTIGSMTINPTEAYETHKTVTKVCSVF